MAFRHNLLALTYPLLRLRTKINRLKNNSSPRLRVLMYHDISPADSIALDSQLRWLRRKWDFVSADTFGEIVDGKTRLKRDTLLLTFDDGFISNRHVADAVLDPLGIKALFFVVTSFIDLKPNDDWRTFVATNICPGTTPEEHPPWRSNMTWNDLAYLSNHGHAIGAHTVSHKRLSCLSNSEMTREIEASARILKSNLGVEPLHFAYTFGDVASFSSEALLVARRTFKYIHTGIRGDNAARLTPCAIFRDALNARDSNLLVGAILEGGADWRYAKSRARYLSWTQI